MRYFAKKQAKVITKPVTLNYSEELVEILKEVCKNIKMNFGLNITLGELICDILEESVLKNRKIYQIDGTKLGVQDMINFKFDVINKKKTYSRIEKRYDDINSYVEQEVAFNEDKKVVDEEFRIEYEEEIINYLEDHVDDILDNYVFNECPYKTSYIKKINKEWYDEIVKYISGYHRWKKNYLEIMDKQFLSVVLFGKTYEKQLKTYKCIVPIDAEIEFHGHDKKVLQFLRNKLHFLEMRNNVCNIINEYGIHINVVNQKKYSSEFIKNIIEDKTQNMELKNLD